MALQIKRGTNLQRQELQLAAGEPFFVTDYEDLGVSPLWIGDGTTYGGVTGVSPANIGELVDVTVSTPAHNNILQYNSGTGQWVNSEDLLITGDAIIQGTATFYTEEVLAISTTADVHSVSYPRKTSNTITNATLAYTGISSGSSLTVTSSTTGTDITTGSRIKLSNAGTLLGISTGTIYYAYDVTSSNFKLASSLANALAGTPIVTTGIATSGTTTIYARPGFGVGEEFILETTEGTDKSVAKTEVVTTAVFPGSESVDYNIHLIQNGYIDDNTGTPALKVKGNGNLELRGSATIGGDVTITGGDLITGTTGRLFNTSTGSVEIAKASNDVSIGSTSGTTVVNNALTSTGSFTVGSNKLTLSSSTGDAVFNTTTQSTSQGDGGVQIKGGVGIVKNLNVGGTIRVDDSADSTSTTTGSIQTDGGLGVALNAYIGQSLTVGGNLTVNGTTTTVNSTTTTLDDPIITLGGDTAPSTDDGKDRGVEFRYYSSGAKKGFFGYDNSTGRLTFLTNATNTSEVFSGTSGDVEFGSAYIGNVVVAGGANNNTISTGSGRLYLDSADNIVHLSANTLDSDAAIISLFPSATDLVFSEQGGGNIIMGAIASPATGLTIYGGMSATGSIDTDSNLTVRGSTTLGNAILSDITNVVGRFTVNTNAIYSHESSTYTGFGTSSPAEKVDVVGNIGLTGYIKSTVGSNDYWKILGGDTGTNAGYLEIATGDDGNEPIFFKQYSGATAINTLTLMDGAGSATFPKSVTITNDLLVSGNLNTADNFITLKYGATGAPSGNIGIIGNRGSSADVVIRWNETTDRWGSTTDGTNYIEFPDQALDTTSAATFASVSLDSRAVLDTATLTTSATTADQVLDSFDKTIYRTVKYLIQATSGSAYHSFEAIVLHDGTTSNIAVYADIKTGSDLTTISTDISAGNVRVLVTPTNAVTTYKVTKTSIVV